MNVDYLSFIFCYLLYWCYFLNNLHFIIITISAKFLVRIFDILYNFSHISLGEFKLFQLQHFPAQVVMKQADVFLNRIDKYLII